MSNKGHGKIQRWRAAYAALSEDIKQRLIDAQRGTLDQEVYSIAEQKLVSVWAVNLCKSYEYIFANDVKRERGILHYARRNLR